MSISDYQTFDEAPAVPPIPAIPPPGVIPIVAGRPQVTVHPRSKDTLPIEDYEPFEAEGEKGTETTPPFREVSPGEAATHGYVDLATFGLAPAIAGATAAGQAPGGTGIAEAMQGAASENPGAEAIGEGISRLWGDHFGNHPDPAANAAYRAGSESIINDRELAKNQHFVPYLLGQVGAALTLPAARAALGGFFGEIAPGLVQGMIGQGALRNIAGAAAMGGTQTGLYEAGTALSEGRPEDIPLEAAKGAASGVALGGLGSTAIGGLSAAAGKVGNIVRGTRDVDAEAGRKIMQALGVDYSKFGPSMTAEEKAAAQQAGTPLGIIDIGQERTRALARASANISPEGRQAITQFVQKRFEQQTPRIAGYVRDMMGGGNTTRDQDVIAAAKAAFNPPAYKTAYMAGDRPIWSPEIERLAGDPDIAAAVAKAARTGKSWSIIDGMSGFNPSVRATEDGRLIFNKGPTGVPTYPNIQFWDYTQRELNGMLNAAKARNDTTDVARLTQLKQMLNTELDKEVPEFARARQTAANFFGADNAVEAGENFVTSKEDWHEAARALSGMKPVERELFARAFSDKLARSIEDVRDRSNVINRAFLDSPNARRKIELALGPDRANRLEALLRAEEFIDQSRQALGNSTTMRQAHEMEMAGGAVGAVESLKHMTLAGVMMTGLGITKARGALAGIDEKVAQRILEMLASDDPAQLQKGVQIISKSPTWMNAMRQATGASARVAAKNIGFTNLAAGATVGAEDIGDIFRKKEHEEEPHHREPVERDYPETMQ